MWMGERENVSNKEKKWKRIELNSIEWYAKLKLQIQISEITFL